MRRNYRKIMITEEDIKKLQKETTELLEAAFKLHKSFGFVPVDLMKAIFKGIDESKIDPTDEQIISAIGLILATKVKTQNANEHKLLMDVSFATEYWMEKIIVTENN